LFEITRATDAGPQLLLRLMIVFAPPLVLTFKGCRRNRSVLIIATKFIITNTSISCISIIVRRRTADFQKQFVPIYKTVSYLSHHSISAFSQLCGCLFKRTKLLPR